MTFKPDPDRPWLNHALPWEKDMANPAQPANQAAIRVLMMQARHATQESIRLMRENVPTSDDYAVALQTLKTALAAIDEWVRANPGK